MGQRVCLGVAALSFGRAISAAVHGAAASGAVGTWLSTMKAPSACGGR
jgi:hypothetical protein